MKKSIGAVIVILLSATLFSAKMISPKDGWISLFDGKTFTGWTINKEHPSTFSIEDGKIVVHGDRAHIFYSGDVKKHDFRNFEFKASVMTTPGSNSGIFIHTAYQDEDWPKQGYEIQVNQTHTDWRKTGSIYAVQDVKEVFVKDNEWYTESVTVVGPKITVKINDKVINEYAVEPGKERAPSGTFALQGHDPNSLVYYKDIMVKPLPD